jgi:hypothetical protein
MFDNQKDENLGSFTGLGPVDCRNEIPLESFFQWLDVPFVCLTLLSSLFLPCASARLRNISILPKQFVNEP